jgi:ketosteroid isomerase-like protein
LGSLRAHWVLTFIRMKSIMLLLTLSFISIQGFSQDKDIVHIRQILKQQEIAWNEGNLEGFMQGYWKSDSLRFIGSRGIQYGWQTTLDNYKKGYPDKAAMGQLIFTILKVEKLSPTSAFIIGQWRLKREKDEPNGHFTLLWKKIKGQWLIVADHSS